MILPLRDNAPGYDVPVVTISIIGICIFVFIIQCIYPGGLVASCDAWGEVPTRIHAGGYVPGTHIPAWITMFTSMWMHADFGHILGNMYALWLFGDNVEWVMGRARYLLFYLVCGLVASVATTYIGYQSDMAGIGASGAILGVLGAYLVCFPRARISSLMFISPSFFNLALYGTWGFTVRNISAFWWMGSYIVFQLVMSFILLGAGNWLNLGIYAHAAGAIAGIGLAYVLRLPDRMPKPEDPSQCAELTLPFIGEEGDAGASYEPVNSLGQEMERLHSLHGYRPAPPPELHDYRADELQQAGLFREALQHCVQMREVAYDEDDRDRVLAYSERITELNGLVENLPPQVLPVIKAKPEPAPAPADGFDLLHPGQVKRGTRHREPAEG
jgi:membrane associated rhomboid family serine protease